MRNQIAVLTALLVTWNSLPSRAQENPVPTVVNEIGRLESERDPKCYATANRLEDFMYGTPLDFEARLEKIALQKDLILGIWSDASVAAAALDREKVSPAEIAPLTAAVLDRAESPTGAVVVVTPSGPSITLLADDVRQYGSVAYSLRAILAVEQESMISMNTLLLPLDEGSVRALKDLLDVYTLAALQLADRQARMANEREISAERLAHAWRSLGGHRQETTHPTFLTDRSDTDSSAQGFPTTRAIIEQKVASYREYNEISHAVFVRNLQVYFARHRWPAAEEEVAFRDYFNNAMVGFATESLLGSEKVARASNHRLVRVEDVSRFLGEILPHEVNAYEDVIFFPRFPAEGRIVVESYDLDAFRDSGLHWLYLKWALEDPTFTGTVEPDPFAAELIVEGIAQFGVLVLRVAGQVAKEEGSERLTVKHLDSGLRRIQGMLDDHAGLPPTAVIPSRVVSSAGSHTPSGRYFTDVTREVDLDFEHRTADWLSRLIRSYAVEDGNVARLAIPPAFGGAGVAAEDIDNDGDPDILLLSGAGNRLFLNGGDGRFIDVTERAGIGWIRPEDGRPGEPRQPIIADFDNDGLQDILITYVDDDHRLYRGLGGHEFADVTKRAGLGGSDDIGGPATAFDFDGDGLLDLYIGSFGDYPRGIFPTLARRNTNGLPNRLFRNLGGLRFEDVTEGSGVANTGWTQAVGHADFDRDGREDLIVGNDFGVNSYYRNLGAGRFEDVAPGLGTDKPSYTMNIGITDLNRDGFPDFYISNIVTMDKDEKYVLPSSSTRMAFDPEHMAHLRVVEANDLFTSRVTDGALDGYTLSDAVGRGRSSTGWSWDADFFDFDNDGDDDLYCVNGMNEYALYSSENPYYSDPDGEKRNVVIPVAERESNVFFVNREGGLENDSKRSGADLLGNSRSVAYLDFDLDGDLDMVVNNFHGPAVFYRNNAEGRGNHWLGIHLVGDPEAGSSRDAVGAVIEVSSDHHPGLWREVLSTTGYLSVHPKTRYFGLGQDTRADVTVHWPGGEVSRFRDVSADEVHSFVQRRPAADDPEPPELP